jgi:hypothetical protein
MVRVLENLPRIPEGALMVACQAVCCTEGAKEVGVFWRKQRLSLCKIERLRKQWVDGGKLEDWLEQVGSGQRALQQTLRYICYSRRGVRCEVLTNVLDSKKLSALQAINLYPERWQVERMVFDLKEVLNLHQFYAANPNAVAMQVYWAALVYTAMRIAQGRIGCEQDLTSEELSPAELFPRSRRIGRASGGGTDLSSVLPSQRGAAIASSTPMP